MTRLMDRPLLHEGPVADVVVDAASVGMPTRHLPPFRFHARHASQPSTGSLEPLVKQAVRIDRGDRRIAIAMERDEWDDLPQVLCVGDGSLLHDYEGRGQIMYSTVGQARMHTDGGIQVRVHRRYNHGHGPASRHPGHVDPAALDLVLAHDLPRDPSNEGGLTPTTLLIALLEPIPTPRAIGRGGLLRI